MLDIIKFFQIENVRWAFHAYVNKHLFPYLLLSHSLR